MSKHCLGHREGDSYKLSHKMQQNITKWNETNRELTPKSIASLPTKRGRIRYPKDYLTDNQTSDNRHRLWREKQMSRALKAIQREIKRIVRSSNGEISVRVPLPSEVPTARVKSHKLSPYIRFCKTLWGRLKEVWNNTNPTKQLPKGYSEVCSEQWRNLTDENKKSPVEAVEAMTEQTLSEILGIRQTRKRPRGRKPIIAQEEGHRD